MNKVVVRTIPRTVRITVSEEEMPLSHPLKESIDSYWHSLMENGKAFHRGEVFPIREFTETEKELQVTLHRTDFAHFIYSKHHNLEDPYKCRVVVANALIVTSDQHVVLGQMNDVTANPGRVQLIAGGIDASDVKGNKVDIIGSLIREAREEVGIDLHDENTVMKIEPRYFVDWGNIALVYRIELAMDSTEFRAHYELFEKSLRDKGMIPEFSSIELLPAEPQSVVEFFEKDPRPKVDFLGDVLKRDVGIG
ncbi:NUDIX hydrolase [Rossellomorea aquimaris]|uniref:NUDIX hydrolase n=1 Tax=Rossellomorea aquimaris TaxID=189382 RepID=UPI001CD61051|nr:NUDIX hydrolase [Rossellomorea aquimaris]MCA1054112.1 NUDIX hydrolase [Rossellomorea aquimaris]